MLRQHLPQPASTPAFRIRAHEVSRIEGFTDAVFGFALTLVVVSLEVPRSFDELFSALRGFPAFAAYFAILLYIWWVHNHLFRRYGLQDMVVFVLNSLLLFLVLFYVYPLKFLFGGLLGGFEIQGRPTVDQVRGMMVCYSGGWAAVFAIFVAMYAHAWRCAGALSLSAAERASTIHMIVHHATSAAFGLASAAVALTVPNRWIGLAGWMYFGIAPALAIVGFIFGRRTQRAAAAGADATPGHG